MGCRSQAKKGRSTRWLFTAIVTRRPWPAIGALAAHPGCSSVIAGATSAEPVKANAAAADWTPAEAELAEIDAIVPPPAAA